MKLGALETTYTEGFHVIEEEVIWSISILGSFAVDTSPKWRISYRHLYEYIVEYVLKKAWDSSNVTMVPTIASGTCVGYKEMKRMALCVSQASKLLE